MQSKIVKANIAVRETQPLQVMSNDDFLGRYDCLNVSGPKVCFSCAIFDCNDSQNSHASFSSSKNEVLGKLISEYIPLCLFYGKKEGDVVELQYENKNKETVTVNVTLNQKLFGKSCFEESLFERTLGFGGIYDPMNEKDISRMSQYCFMITAHHEYSYSIGKMCKESHTFRFSNSWVEECKKESEKEPTLSYLQKITNAMGNCDDTMSPVERLGTAMLKVKLEEKNI